MAEETIRRRSRGIRLVFLVALSLAAWVCRPMIQRQRVKADHVSAISSLRCMGFGLLEFESAFGKLPDAQSARKLNESGKLRWSLDGGSANDYLRQLVAAEIVSTEVVFHARTSYTCKPDNRWTEENAPIAAGECGFGYVMNRMHGFKSSDAPEAVIACGPLDWDGREVSRTRFDPVVYGGCAAVLFADNSVMAPAIEPATQEVRFPDGRRLWDAEPGSRWGEGASPVVVPPLPKP